MLSASTASEITFVGRHGRECVGYPIACALLKCEAERTGWPLTKQVYSRTRLTSRPRQIKKRLQNAIFPAVQGTETHGTGAETQDFSSFPAFLASLSIAFNPSRA